MRHDWPAPWCVRSNGYVGTAGLQARWRWRARRCVVLIRGEEGTGSAGAGAGRDPLASGARSASQPGGPGIRRSFWTRRRLSWIRGWDGSAAFGAAAFGGAEVAGTAAAEAAP